MSEGQEAIELGGEDDQEQIAQDNEAGTATGADGEEEEELDEIEKMKRSLAEIEEEAKKIEEMQQQVESAMPSEVDKAEVDARSVFIGNVDFSTTQQELEAHFKACGAVKRVTILVDKWTGQAKGYAYVEFESKDAVPNALELSESVFKGRVIKVSAKRTNVPTFMMSGRGRGGAGAYGSPRGGARGGSPRGGGRGSPARGGGRGGGRGRGYYGGRGGYTHY